jgi:hypothetical protein
MVGTASWWRLARGQVLDCVGFLLLADVIGNNGYSLPPALVALIKSRFLGASQPAVGYEAHVEDTQIWRVLVNQPARGLLPSAYVSGVLDQQYRGVSDGGRLGLVYWTDRRAWFFRIQFAKQSDLSVSHMVPMSFWSNTRLQPLFENWKFDPPSSISSRPFSELHPVAQYLATAETLRVGIRRTDQTSFFVSFPTAYFEAAAFELSHFVGAPISIPTSWPTE